MQSKKSNISLFFNRNTWFPGRRYSYGAKQKRFNQNLSSYLPSFGRRNKQPQHAAPKSDANTYRSKQYVGGGAEQKIVLPPKFESDKNHNPVIPNGNVLPGIKKMERVGNGNVMHYAPLADSPKPDFTSRIKNSFTDFQLSTGRGHFLGFPNRVHKVSCN